MLCAKSTAACFLYTSCSAWNDATGNTFLAKMFLQDSEERVSCVYIRIIPRVPWFDCLQIQSTKLTEKERGFAFAA